MFSWTFRLQDPNKRLAVIVFMISSGVALASRGELRFNLFGFIVQAAAVAVSPSRIHSTTDEHLLRTRAVRGVPARDDRDSSARHEDEPARLAALLRARLRAHQPRRPSIHLGPRALLRDHACRVRNGLLFVA